jgi:hypothetical protein
MKRIFIVAISALAFLSSMAQSTITGDRVVAKQGIYVKDKWIDSIQNSGTPSSSRVIPTAKLVSDSFIKNQSWQKQNASAWIDSLKASSLTIGSKVDGTVQKAVLNNPSKRNLLVGDAPTTWTGVGDRYDDSTSYNFIGVTDTFNVSDNTSTLQWVGKIPRATLGIDRTQIIGGNNQNLELGGALDIRKTFDMRASDTLWTWPSTADFVWTTRNRTTVRNNVWNGHKAVVRSGDWNDSTFDATPVTLSTLEVLGNGTAGTTLKGWWSGNTSYFIGTSAHDTIDKWMGFFSTGASPWGPYINRSYDFAANHFNTGNMKEHWFLYQSPFSGTDTTYSFINGRLALGGGFNARKQRPQHRLEVNGGALLDTGYFRHQLYVGHDGVGNVGTGSFFVNGNSTLSGPTMVVAGASPLARLNVAGSWPALTMSNGVNSDNDVNFSEIIFPSAYWTTWQAAIRAYVPKGVEGVDHVGLKFYSFMPDYGYNMNDAEAMRLTATGQLVINDSTHNFWTDGSTRLIVKGFRTSPTTMVAKFQSGSTGNDVMSILNNGTVKVNAILNLAASTAPSSSSDASGTDGDIKRDASGNLYLKAGTTWLKFTGSTF